MKPILSVCTNLFFPNSRASLGEFRDAAEFIAEHGARSMEFYHDGSDYGKCGNILNDYSLDGVLIAVIPLKEGLMHLCATDEDNRRAALETCYRLMSVAVDGGVRTLMVNSGKFEPGREGRHMDALTDSLERLYNKAVRHNMDISIELEPCDSAIDARQFIGPYQRTRQLCDIMKRRGAPIRLTMDSAHTAEEFQDFCEALAHVKEYCGHIHFANCFLGDAESPLYGDKHLGFEYPDTPFGFDALEALTQKLDALYPGNERLRIGLEVLCREDDPFRYFERTLARLPLQLRR